MSGSSREYHPTENLTETLGLFEGQILRATVHTNLPDDKQKVLLNLKNKRVIAQTELDVEAGDSLIVEVKSLQVPIELSLYEPEDASQSLNTESIEAHLEEQGLEPNKDTVETARQLISHQLPLDAELLKKAHSIRDFLFDQDHDRTASRLQGLGLLHNNELPANQEAISVLEGLNNTNGESLLNGKSVEAFLYTNPNLDINRSPDTPQNFDLKKTLQDLGFDLVNQLGRWPDRASRSLHAVLLKDFKADRLSEAGHSLLAAMFAVSINNLDGDKDLFFPFLEEGARLARVQFVKDDDVFQKARISAEFSDIGTVDVSIQFKQTSVTIDIYGKDLPDHIPVTKLCNRLQTDDESVTANVHPGQTLQWAPIVDGPQPQPTAESPETVNVVA